MGQYREALAQLLDPSWRPLHILPFVLMFAQQPMSQCHNVIALETRSFQSLVHWMEPVSGHLFDLFGGFHQWGYPPVIIIHHPFLDGLDGGFP